MIKSQRNIHVEDVMEPKGDKMGKPNFKDYEGKVGYILLWLLGVPIPILLLIFLVRGCN
jgi:hypothetical protein